MARIKVIHLQTGQTGSIPEESFDSKVYKKVSGQGSTNGATKAVGSILEFLFPQTTKLPEAYAQNLATRRQMAQDPMWQGVAKSPEQFGKRLVEGVQANIPLARQAAAAGGELGATLAAGTGSLNYSHMPGQGLLKNVLSSAPAKGSAAIGAISGLLDPENKSVTETIGNTAMGAGIGYGTGVLFAGWGEKTFKDKQKLAQEVLRQSKLQVKLNDEGLNKTASRLVEKLENKTLKPDSVNGLRNQSAALLKETDGKLQKVLQSYKGDKVITVDELVAPVDELIKTAKDTGNRALASRLDRWKSEYVARVGTRFGKNLSPQVVNRLKKELYTQLNDNAFKKSAEQLSTAQASAMRKVAQNGMFWLRDNVKEASTLLDDEQFYIELGKAMEGRLRSAGTASSGIQGIGGIYSRLINALGGPLKTAPVQTQQIQGAPFTVSPLIQNLMTQKMTQS